MEFCSRGPTLSSLQHLEHPERVRKSSISFFGDRNQHQELEMDCKLVEMNGTYHDYGGAHGSIHLLKIEVEIVHILFSEI